MSKITISTLSASRMRNTTLALIAAASLLMALSAHVAVRVPFSPVPITAQTLALPLVVALLGTRRATAALLLYLAEGATGLPVFAPGTTPGMFALIGPTAGYLWSFPVAAFVIGSLFDLGLVGNVAGRAIAIVAGEIVIFACGAFWLAHFVGLDRAFALGVAPFLIGDALKVGIATALGGGAARLLSSALRG